MGNQALAVSTTKDVPHIFPRSRRIVRRLRSHRAGDGANRTTSAREWASHTNVCLIGLLKTIEGGGWRSPVDMCEIGCANQNWAK